MMSDCPVCGQRCSATSQTHRVSGIDHEFRLHGCAVCQVDHWSPLVHPGASFYESEQVAIYKALHESKEVDDPRFARFFSVFAPRGKSFLDIGCSNGAFLSMARDRGNVVEGVDIDEKALAVARTKGIEVSRSSIEDFVAAAVSKDSRYDFVTVFDVVEHLVDPVKELRRLSEILSPSGMIVGTVPNKQRLFANQMPIDFPPHHFFRFSAQGIAATLRAAGLRVQQVETFQYNYAGQTLLNMALRRLRGRRRAASVTAEGVPSKARPRVMGGLKNRITGGIAKAMTPLSYALERPTGRGFKLFFAASKQD